MVGIPRGRLGVGGKFISTFIDSMGNAGKIVDADDIDDLDVFVDARVTTTSGEGSKVFVVTATYDASTGVLRFGSFRGGFPSTIAVGDVVVFVSPSNIEDDQDITVDDQVNSNDRNLFDIDANVVQGRQLSPGRLYWAQRLFEGLFEAYHLALPLGVYQITPAQTASVTITNAQLKTLDTDPIEIIPAPGAGRVIEVMRMAVEASGSDMPTSTDTESTGIPDSQTINGRGRLAIGFVDGTARTMTPYGWLSPDTKGGFDNAAPTWALREVFTGSDFSDRFSIGGQTFYDDTALMLEFVISALSQSSIDRAYTEAVWDEWWATANDNTLTIEVEYVIHD